MSLVVNVWPIKWSSFRLTNTPVMVSRFLQKFRYSLYLPADLTDQWYHLGDPRV